MSVEAAIDDLKSRCVQKTPTGVKGLDEITQGGLPRNRSTLVCGGPGCGKTLLSMEFIVNGISRFGENGAYISFDESKSDLAENVASLGFDIEAMIARKALHVTSIPIHPGIAGEFGEYDLGGLFATIGHAIDSVGAKRLVIDGIDNLFSFFSNESIIRQELRKLIKWLKEKEVTVILTCERGEGRMLLTRHGIEEYISDCVILLDQRIIDQIAVRRLKIVKYRGALHGTNEYPFLVTEQGIIIFPVTSMALDYEVAGERVSTGLQGLDGLLSNNGYFKGSSSLVAGGAGAGKSSLAGSFSASICKEGKRCIYFAFEEPAAQIIRNMSSIGLDLAGYRDSGLLKIHATRPTEYGVEMHLLSMHTVIESFKPEAVVFDPISSLTDVGLKGDIRSMFIRILDYLKNRQITNLSTDLTQGGGYRLDTDIGISSIMDTWIIVKNRERDNYKERLIEIVKSRGMAHIDRIQGFKITNDGIFFNEL
jgi:circadian clock protein KaiC